MTKTSPHTVWGAGGLVSRTADCWMTQKFHSRLPHLEEKTQIRTSQTPQALTLLPLGKHNQNIPASQHPGNSTYPALCCHQWVDKQLGLNVRSLCASLNCSITVTHDVTQTLCQNRTLMLLWLFQNGCFLLYQCLRACLKRQLSVSVPAASFTMRHSLYDCFVRSVDKRN